jgi:hypothetical protein
VVFNNQKKASFRVTLIIVLLVAMYGVLPMGASAQTSAEPASQDNGCYPGSGWMWAAGPSEPDLASQAQAELAQQGIQALVEAHSYGETDSCATYNPHGVDFSIKFLATQSEQWSSQEALNDAVLSILNKYGKPDLGLVKLISSDGQLISNNINQKNSTSKEAGLDAPSDKALAGNPVTKNVYVIVYDPLLGNGQRLTQRMGWSDHATITQQTVDFFNQAVNKINYVVVETTVVTSGWPELIDGYRYAEEEFLAVVNKQQAPHDPPEVDYNRILSSPQFDICGKVNRGEIDEVWIYNGPYFGFYESTLVGPGAYRFNSPPVGGVHNCNRILPIMGPSLERTVHEAIHNFGHRGEDTMTKVYGSWQQNNTSHNWNKFALVKVQSPSYSYSGCGSIHFPPNGTFGDGMGYDYDNPLDVLSNCDDFANYPNLSDPLQVAQPVNCSRWGCDQLGYLQYWFGHFPSFAGCGPDNRANDWWKYFANPAYALYPANGCQPDMHIISGNTGAPGALLSYTDGSPKTVTADANGNYFLMVSNNWSGTVTPSRTNHTFTPASRSYTSVLTEMYNQDYAPQGSGPVTYYVNIATGNNSNTCTSTGAPCRNLQEAINKANPGDLIKVANGRYLFSTNPTPNVVIIDKNLTLSGGWNAGFTSQTGASTIDGANVNNGILIISGTVTVENFIVENSVSANSGAIYIVNGNLTLRKSTLRNNFASSNGAGIFLYIGTVNVINSTISGNQADDAGGGIYTATGGASVTIQNSTIAYNQASRGGGISRTTGSYNLTNTILANNTSSISSPDCEGTIAQANYSLIENMSGCAISSGSNNLNLDPQLDSAWTGVMSVHMPLNNSPVINAGTSTGCPATDQIGTLRPYSTSCDIGAVEYVGVINTPTHTPTFTPTKTSTSTPTSTFTVTPSISNKPLYLSLANNQTIGGISSADEDILRFDGTNWSLFFDGSDVGVGSPDLFAFSIVDADTILMSFSANVTVNGIAATPQDVLRFDATSLGSTTAGAFSMHFDGSDVSFADATNEKIDSLTVLPDGRLLISATGNPSVPGATAARDEDVLAFTPTSLGDVTSGAWAMYFDGSDVGLSETSGEDIDALDVVGNTIYLSTQDLFSVAGVAGEDDDVFVCAATSIGDVTACNYSSALYFDGSTWGLTANDVDAFNFLVPGSTPTAIPTNTPTHTPTGTATATSAPGGQLTFTALADARVSQPSPTTNYGTDITLQADGDSGAAQTSFIRFHASGISGPIQSAKLRVFCTTNGTANGPAAYLANNNWIESGTGGVNWNNRPALESGAFDNKGAIAANSWVEYDVTALITANGTYTFALVADSSDGIVFSSREGATSPQLVVTLGGEPATSTPTATSPSSITDTPTWTPSPIVISVTPTFTPTTTQTSAASLFTFVPAADAYVDANSPTSNYGSLATLRVDASPVVRSYLRFTVQGVNGTVARATLRVYANSSSSQGCTASSVSNSAWSESTLNYNNAPPPGSTLGSSGLFGANAWFSIDVTPYITGNGTYTLALTTPGTTAVSLASLESGAHAPQLILETTP